MYTGLLFSVAVAFLAASQSRPAEDVLYSPAQIEGLISSGAAQPHGAQFENKSLGCRTFLWRQSDAHRVFFFSRDGKVFGEYRDETLENGRFVRTDEVFLATEVRHKMAKGSVPFVRRLTTFQWDKKTWVGSAVQWTLLLREPDGTVTKHVKEGAESFVKGTVRVVVPAVLMKKERQYFLNVYKQIPSEFDKAFYDRIEEGKGLPLGAGPVTGNQCEIRADWPTDDPDFLFVLNERIPNPSRDANPSMIRTKGIASMRRTSPVNDGQIINFVPDEH